MALRRNAPDKVKLKLRGDGAPLGDLGNDLLPKGELDGPASASLIRDADGHSFLDWSGGDGTAMLGHPDPKVTEAMVAAAVGRLGELDRDSHSRLVTLTERLANGLGDLANDAPGGLGLEVRSSPGLVFVSLNSGFPGAYESFRGAMLKRDIWLPLTPEAPWLMTLDHDSAAIDRTVLAAGDALGELG
ncbi:MAG: hypothetical protein M9938_00065 [Solirubrobacterales bacterium]|nr:hypothetical protein [Solirubrobacterales bacterium]